MAHRQAIRNDCNLIDRLILVDRRCRGQAEMDVRGRFGGGRAECASARHSVELNGRKRESILMHSVRWTSLLLWLTAICCPWLLVGAQCSGQVRAAYRSEEHTSELQSLRHL